MKNSIIISDVHARPDMLVRVIEHARKRDARVIFAGDMLDRGNEPGAVIDAIYNNLDIVDVIIGNHDDMLYHAFDIYDKSDSVASQGVSNIKGLFIANDKGARTTKYVAGEYMDPQFFYNKDYIHAIKHDNKEVIDKITTIKNASVKYMQSYMFGKTVRISHTGNFTDDESTNKPGFMWGLEPTLKTVDYRKQNDIIDIVGHWSTPHVIEYCESNGIKYEMIDESVFVPTWHTVYVDNGHGSNVTTIHAIMKYVSEYR